MQRLEATRIAAELAGDAPIIGGVGNNTFDLVPFDRPRNFYMWNSMGNAGVNAVAASWRFVLKSAQVSYLRSQAAP